MIVDPMLATGGSAEAAVDFVKKQGGKNIKFMCIIAAPEGLKRLHEAHPDVQIYCGHLDRELNDHAYICPGLGEDVYKRQVLSSMEFSDMIAEEKTK